MGSKAQQRKERHARKRKEKRKKEQARERRGGTVLMHNAPPVGSNVRHRQRLQQQVPQAWPGEAPEDAAVFDDTVLASLSPELAQQVVVVRESLQAASESRGDEALKRASVIPRSSPLSEWRLFIRGLMDWLANEEDAAGEAWGRLNPERRPGRMATSMMVALRSDLDQLSLAAHEPDGASEEGSPAEWLRRCDDQLLYHAKLVRRVRFDRAAIQVAEAGLKVPEEVPKLKLGPAKIEWLRRFIAEYGDTEPDLAAALSQVALGRAFAQNFSDLFDEAVRVFEGPRHDRRNRLLTFFYFNQFESPSSEKKAEQALQGYLQKDLPQNQALSEPLRKAIASRIHLNEAGALMQPRSGIRWMDNVFGPVEDTAAIRKHFRESEEACPANREAYTAHVAWIKSSLDDDRMTKKARAPFEKELAGVMKRWSKGLPNDIEPRLWLVDHLLENEEIEAARPHVEFLAGSRHEDPRVRATPWKWELLEAMRLCRRKAWLSHVPARLDEAEKLWPAWLSKQWLPYLRAAWLLRSGQTEQYAAERQRITGESGLVPDSLADACLMLGAAQQLRASAEELRQLRALVDQALKTAGSRPLDDLLATGSFFWDLHRTQLVYPAYRMHGAKIGKALLARIAKEPRRILDSRDDDRFQASMLWCSEHRFWSDPYDIKLPACFANPAFQRHPMFVAARLNASLGRRHLWEIEKEQSLGTLLREAAPSQRDAFYRHWFVALADKLDDAISSDKSSLFSRFVDMFGPGGNATFGDGDGDESDDVLGYNPDCKCAECQAARQAAAGKSTSSRGRRHFF